MKCRPRVCQGGLSDLQMGVSATLPLHSPNQLPAVALWGASAVPWAGEDVRHGSSLHALPGYEQG